MDDRVGPIEPTLESLGEIADEFRRLPGWLFAIDFPHRSIQCWREDETFTLTVYAAPARIPASAQGVLSQATLDGILLYAELASRWRQANRLRDLAIEAFAVEDAATADSGG